MKKSRKPQREIPKNKSTEQESKQKTGKLTFQAVDRNSFTPMYYQIQMQLLKLIESGQLRPGDSFPGEEELTRIYGVSRMTSRQALQALTSQGFAYRQRGRGTFVSQPKVEKNIAHLLGFSAEMRQLGLKPSSRILKKERMLATPEIAVRLGIQANAATFYLQRLRLADGVPVALEEVWLPQEQFPGIEKVDFVRCSLYETLRERYEVRVGSADEIIEAQPASRRESELLKIAPRSSLLVIARILLSVEGKPVEVAHSLYRGDRYRAVLRILATTSK